MEFDEEDILVFDFIKFWFNFKPYEYQRRFLSACLHQNRVVGKWCRQSGKSQTVAWYSLFRATTGKVTILIFAPAQRQSKELFEKIRSIALDNPYLNSSIEKSTETELVINGSRIISLPVGHSGINVKGYTADIIILEECQGIKDMIVNTVILPMIASKKDAGQVIKIGTPETRNHFYNSCFIDKDYTVINVTWRDAVKAGQYTQKFIDEQREKLLDIEFRTEYEVEFIDDEASFFTPSLLQSCMEEYPLITI